MKFPKKKSLGTACFTGELYQMFKEEITPVLRTSFKKTKQKHFPIHVIKLVFTDTKTRKFVKIQYQKKKKNTTSQSILLMNMDIQMCYKILANRIINYMKRQGWLRT